MSGDNAGFFFWGTLTPEQQRINADYAKADELNKTHVLPLLEKILESDITLCDKSPIGLFLDYHAGIDAVGIHEGRPFGIGLRTDRVGQGRTDNQGGT
jgi:hypothetical protein